VSNSLNVFLFHPLLVFAIAFYIAIAVSLVTGKVSRRYTTPVYRFEEPAKFRNYLVVSFTAGTVCLVITVKNWTPEYDPPDYSYYTVLANPSQSLETVMQEASKLHSNGGVAYGVTFWDAEWHFEWSQGKQGDTCWINSVYTTLRTQIVLPKLVNANADQQKQFNIFFEALRAHQLAHYEFGKSAALEIEKKISNLPKMQYCATLEAAGNAVGEETVKKYQMKEQAYDMSNPFLQSQHALLD